MPADRIEQHHTPAEVARKLRLSRSTVVRLLRGPAPARRSVRIGRLVRIPESTIQDFLRTRSIGG
jgi:excisionase family DNA binding protein